MIALTILAVLYLVIGFFVALATTDDSVKFIKMMLWWLPITLGVDEL